MSNKSNYQENSYEESLIEEIRVNTDLIELAGEYVNLKAAGKSYKGLCPFHEEQTPSFNIDPNKQLYYCFGCGAGGNAYNFVMELEGLNFPEAVKFLADRNGIQLPDKQNSQAYQEVQNKKDRLKEIHNLAYKFYNYLLTEKDIGSSAKEYLKARDFSEEIIEKFKLGFAPDRWQGIYRFLSEKGYSDELLAESGLVLPRKTSGYYDRFRNRVIFTICDFRGRIIGFGGRIITDVNQPKYLNSPETLIFNKSQNLYGLNWAKQSIKQSDEAIVVEGYTDVIRAHQFGLENVVASLGTSLTKEQGKLLKRYAKKVYIAYDSDTAGAEATLRGLDILKGLGFKVKVIQLPTGSDPDDFIAEQGIEEFKKLRDSAIALIDFKLNQVIAKRDLSEIDNKVNVVHDVLNILAQIDNKIELDEHIKKLTERLDISGQLLRSELKEYRFNKRRDNKEQTRNNKNRPKLEEKLKDTERGWYENTIINLIKMMINQTPIISKIRAELDVEDFFYSSYQEIIEQIFKLDLNDEQIEVNDILQKLDSKKSRDILLRASLTEDEQNYNNRIINDYINKIKDYQLKMEKKNLNKQIRQAEIEGDDQQLMELLQKYQQLIRKEGS